MKKEIEKEIELILVELGVKNPTVILISPSYLDQGDYSTNVSMIYAKELGKNPRDLAEEIKSKVKIENIIVKTAGVGFLNFYFDDTFFSKNISHIMEMDEGIYAGKKFFIEHTQPNPFKTFHIGHLMNNAIGEAVARIVSANKAEVKTATYHGDKGLHVAKAIWALLGGTSLFEAYSKGHKAYEEDEEAKKEIEEINVKIYEERDESLMKVYEDGRAKSLSEFEKMYELLGSSFDFHFFESESGEIGGELVRENIGKVFENGENGAVIFRGENFSPKTHTRVFLNSDGLPTYEAKELGLAKIKKEWFEYDKSITITANEQDSFFDVVEVAIGEVFPDLKGKLCHLSHGILKFSSGKMSSREGNIISALDLIDQVRNRVLNKMTTSKNLSKDISDIEEVAEVIAIGAIKYSILRQAIGGDIIFDIDKSISLEGDSGPYLQYSAVRARSVLENAKPLNIISESKVPMEWVITNLERILLKWKDVLKESGKDFAPHKIATYLTLLSGEFNSFYASTKILDKGDLSSSYKLFITEEFLKVMVSGLNLLAIKVPKRM